MQPIRYEYIYLLNSHPQTTSSVARINSTLSRMFLEIWIESLHETLPIVGDEIFISPSQTHTRFLRWQRKITREQDNSVQKLFERVPRMTTRRRQWKSVTSDHKSNHNDNTSSNPGSKRPQKRRLICCCGSFKAEPGTIFANPACSVVLLQFDTQLWEQSISISGWPQETNKR